jgi:hypothetical protein
VAEVEDRYRFAKPPSKPEGMPSQWSERWDRNQALYDNLPEDDPASIEAKDALFFIAEQMEPELPDFVGQPVMTKLGVGGVAKEIDAVGNVRDAPGGLTADEAAQHAREEEEFADLLGSLRDEFTEIRLRQEYQASVPPEFANEHREKTNQMITEAVAKREQLRASRVTQYEQRGLSHSEAVEMLTTDDGLGPRLGETKPVIDDKVLASVEAIKAGTFGASEYAGLTARERYELQQHIGEVDARLADTLLARMESEAE